MKVQEKISLPESASNFWVNFLGIVVFFTALVIGRRYFPQMGVVSLALGCLLLTVVPLWLYDFVIIKVYQRPSTGLVRPGRLDLVRYVRKLIGLYGTFLIILILYQFNPVYHHSLSATEFYQTFFEFLNVLAPWIMGASFVYFWQMDRWQKDPYDGYWHMGCLLTGHFKEVKGIILTEHAKTWFIKAFFLPFMFAVLIAYMNELFLFQWGRDARSFLPVFNYLLSALYAVDIIYGVLGYILTVRLLDTQIQSTEPTWIGWLVCLACYYPFSTMWGIGLFKYEDDFHWEHWFAFYPVSYYVCGITIIVLTLIIALATVAIGYRMSNLTYRGLITSGPYRWSKHPAYVSKVASWWLISLPFFSVESPQAAIYHTFNLSMISLIYYLRARTEENHLSNYPEYVQYANWINDHGILRLIGRIFPALRYSEEKCKQWKSVVWFKQLGSRK